MFLKAFFCSAVPSPAVSSTSRARFCMRVPQDSLTKTLFESNFEFLEYKFNFLKTRTQAFYTRLVIESRKKGLQCESFEHESRLDTALIFLLLKIRFFTCDDAADLTEEKEEAEAVCGKTRTDFVQRPAVCGKTRTDFVQRPAICGEKKKKIQLKFLPRFSFIYPRVSNNTNFQKLK